jgi:predicted amidohydrolase
MEIRLVQMAVTRGNPDLNRAKVKALTAPSGGAADAGKSSRPGREPALVVLPELFSTGFLDTASAAEPGPAGPGGEAWEEVAARDREFLSSLARNLGCWVAGTTVEAGAPGVEGPRFRNASLAVDPEGRVQCTYRKIHPFSFGGEDKLFSGGREVAAFPLADWTVQPTICYDLRFPELYRAGSRRGVHLILVQANWPEARQAHWETLLRARAIENQAFVAGVNCVGAQGTLRYAGGSALVNPKGETLVQGGDAEGVFSARADLDFCRQWRRAFPALRDRMPPGFYPE